MKALSKDLGELSGQAGDNARGRLDLTDIGAYKRIGGPVHHPRGMVKAGKTRVCPCVSAGGIYFSHNASTSSRSSALMTMVQSSTDPRGEVVA